MANVTQLRCKGRKAAASPAVFFLWVLAVMITVGSMGCKNSSPAPNGPGKDSHGPPVRVVLHLEPLVVNLADPEENRFLRVGIDLGLENQPFGKEGKGGEGEVPTARIRDCLITVLSTWTSAALLAPEGKQKLKDELVHMRFRIVCPSWK
jgi:flagellar FliL protein